MISTLEQKIAIAGVEDVEITEPVFDEASGAWTREIKIEAVHGESTPIILTVTLSSLDRAGINLTAPVQQF